MTIGILLCGDISATLQADFVIRRLLGSRSATVFNVQNGQLPRSISDCEAYVITGVYDGQRWINDLMTFLRSARRGDSKLIGICFGHQAMAKAFGALSSNRRGAGGRSPPLRVARAAILDR
jgi:GMP synthase-like glutamine amidotransferase